jgi:pyroglutamyl-peptidase
MKILLTAFGPFGNYDVNPSELVLNEVSKKITFGELIDFKIIDVGYDSVNNFINSLTINYDLIVHLGVAFDNKKTRFEIVAHNTAKGKDVFNVEPQMIIEKNGNDYIISNFPECVLEKAMEKFPNHIVYSRDAGTFLCNYIYYKSLNTFQRKTSVLFVHIADFINNNEANSLQIQSDIVISIISDFHEKIKMV